MKVIQYPNPLLKTISKEVKLPLSKEDEKIAKELVDYLSYANQESNDERAGVGIAAVQLGYLKQMFYVNFNFGNYHFEDLLINPKIISKKGRSAIGSGEGCLSVPESQLNTSGLVHRSSEIIMEGYSYFKKEKIKYELSGFPAIVFQHEYDHLKGILFFEKIDQEYPDKKRKNENIIV